MTDKLKQEIFDLAARLDMTNAVITFSRDHEPNRCFLVNPSIFSHSQVTVFVSSAAEIIAKDQ